MVQTDSPPVCFMTQGLESSKLVSVPTRASGRKQKPGRKERIFCFLYASYLSSIFHQFIFNL